MITNLKDQLIRDEGVVLTAYVDSVGKTTVGVGRNLVDVGLSLEEAMVMLTTDIARVTLGICKALPWTESLDEVRKSVLLNMAFNLGIAGLLKFTKTLDLVKVKDYAGASREMLKSKWATQVGVRAIRLSQQMLTGVWQ